MDECIICCDSKGVLISNNACPCNYMRHNNCWTEYIHHTTPLKCPMCRCPLLKPHPSAPPPLSMCVTSPIVSEGREISYQEFVEIISQHARGESATELTGRSVGPLVPIRPRRSKLQTFLGILVLVCLMAFTIIGLNTFF
jgi:hypothetical protein